MPAGIPKGNEPMRFIAETTSNGVSERLFTLDDIPGVLWSPAVTGRRPLVLLGHGGGQHKTAPGLVARAHRHVRTLGLAVAARAVPEWQSTLDALQAHGLVGGPAGYWGVSPGSAISVWLVA
jgi:hypothetical protein